MAKDYSAVDAEILQAIQSYEGIPTARNLSKANGGPLEYGRTAIQGRLDSNPELRRALYLKRGLTEDRINALEIEHENQTPAMIESVKRRLPNMRIFREALGLLNQFQSIFAPDKKIAEVSFYPEPLGRAADMFGLGLQPQYVRAHPLKNPDFRFAEGLRADTVALLQCCHRLSNESLINAFNEANRILAEAGTLLVSLPHEYSAPDCFFEQVQDFGFALMTEGTLHIRTLTIEELAALGVPEPDKLKQKVEQETTILILAKTMPATGRELHDFVMAQKGEGNGEFIPSTAEIDTPDEVLSALAAAFRERRRDLGDAFMLSVLDDGYQQREVFGHDMDPRNPRTVEHDLVSKPPLLSAQERDGILGSLLVSTFQNKVCIKSGHETKIPARIVRSALTQCGR